MSFVNPFTPWQCAIFIPTLWRQTTVAGGFSWASGGTGSNPFPLTVTFPQASNAVSNNLWLHGFVQSGGPPMPGSATIIAMYIQYQCYDSGPSGLAVYSAFNSVTFTPDGAQFGHPVLATMPAFNSLQGQPPPAVQSAPSYPPFSNPNVIPATLGGYPKQPASANANQWAILGVNHTWIASNFVGPSASLSNVVTQLITGVGANSTAPVSTITAVQLVVWYSAAGSDMTVLGNHLRYYRLRH